MKNKKQWKRDAFLDDNFIGTLFLPRKPEVGSKLLVPDFKNLKSNFIITEVIFINKEHIKLKRKR